MLSKYGESHLSTGWGSKASQSRRFEVLSEIGLSPHDTILDVGCGLGEFNFWLIQNEHKVQYSGIDVTDSMIKRAQEKFPNNQFRCMSLNDVKEELDAYDFVFASGIFYLKTKNSLSFMEEAIQTMYLIAKKGVAFNSLSSWSPSIQKDEFFADPVVVLELCRNLTKNIVFRHDYHSSDFSIYLYK